MQIICKSAFLGSGNSEGSIISLLEHVGATMIERVQQELAENHQLSGEMANIQ
ncbi:hypothetical protein [Paenisporosarcina sp. OV554]|uniref:hypothetical protein n=1 Tax=Paenisporosarcina sp. OV554 TaxID=2135694 RepID=UPI001304BDFC|nr:hypothetical protein [Paenisporosarcina sp. OV554]